MYKDITTAMQIARPQCMRGILRFPDGTEFYYGSGSPTKANHPSCPLGSAYFGKIEPAPSVPGGEGYLLHGSANDYDPKVGRPRSEIMIHRGRTSDPSRLASWGCIVIPNDQFDYFKEKIDELLYELADIWINIHPSSLITISDFPDYNFKGQGIYNE